MKRKTQEEYVAELKRKIPHVRVVEEYKKNRVPIKHYCLKHGIEWSVSPFNLLQHSNGCIECQKEAHAKHIKSVTKTHEQFLNDVEALNTGIKPLGIYKNSKSAMKFKCKNGHVWENTPHEILAGYGCPYCAGNKLIKGFNDMWTTHPDIARMLLNKDDGYKFSVGSHKKLDFVCPDCGKIKKISPHQIKSYGFSCPICSDGISYPNKFLRAMLFQLPVANIHYEWKPDWVKPYSYDGYFEYNGMKYVIEMDGALGHGNNKFRSKEKDVEGLKRDVIKDKLANEHDIIVIRVDCAYYDMLKRFEYVKNGVLNSELSKIFDLNLVDFKKCNEHATKNNTMHMAKLYDSGKSIREISNELNISYSTVYNKLKMLAKEGLCTYSPAMGAPEKKL